MPDIKKGKEGDPLQLLQMIGGAGLDEETAAALREYTKRKVRQMVAEEEKEAERLEAHKKAGVELARAFSEGQKRKTAVCGRNGHRKEQNKGTRLVGFRLSNGQYSFICQRCQTLWFHPAGPGQTQIPEDLLQQINFDEVGG